MRGHFSIEWMAQSSQTDSESSTRTPRTPRAPRTPRTPRAPGSISASGPAACGTHSESLPGFYCWQKSENLTQPEQQENQNHEEFRDQVTEASGFSSGTEEETSGYESEGGHSLSPPTTASDGASSSSASSSSSSSSSSSPPSPPVGRRPRTAFTAEQISSLEKAFKKNAYLGQQDKAELCKKLSLSDKQVRNWFQNRRMKLKRTVQDALAHACQVNAASQFIHYPDMQPYRPGPYPRYHAAVSEAPPAASSSSSSSYGLPYGSALPLDSLYPYGGLPGVVLPSAPSRVSYPGFPQYY